MNGSYQIASAWSLRGSVAVTWDHIDLEQFIGGSLVEDPGPTFGDFTNIPWFDKRRSKGGNGVLDLNGQFRTGALSHNILIGADYYQLGFSDRGFVNGWAPVDTKNIFHFGLPPRHGLWSACRVARHAPRLDERREHGVAWTVCAGSNRFVEEPQTARRRPLRLDAE